MLQALPTAAFFLFLEAATGGTIALVLLHVRRDLPDGFTIFTGWILGGCAALALWLRLSFGPSLDVGVITTDLLWLAAERALTIALIVLLVAFLVAVQTRRRGAEGLLEPALPLVALGALWAAAAVQPGTQVGGLGERLATLAGGLALGSAIVGLSLGHWYLVSPTLSTRPLVRVTFLCLGAIVAEALLQPLLLLWPFGGAPAGETLVSEQGLFFAVRVLFGIVVPLVATLGVWRTARIRSLDSATGLLYVVATLVLVGEIAARSLFFLTGIAT